jgi:ketosteroid isomerase-like protein
MARENLEIVRTLYELISSPRGTGPEAVDSVLGEYASDEFELRLPPDYPEGQQVHRGHEGMNQIVAVLQETWSEWRFVPERFAEADDQVVVFARLFAVGQGSGVPIERETNHVWTIRNGRATSMFVYRDRSEALGAVGLSEEAAAVWR